MGAEVDNRTVHLSGMVAAAGIGLALTVGCGAAAAEPTSEGSDSSSVSASESADSAGESDATNAEPTDNDSDGAESGAADEAAETEDVPVDDEPLDEGDEPDDTEGEDASPEAADEPDVDVPHDADSAVLWTLSGSARKPSEEPDAPLTQQVGAVVNVKDYGAVGDGVTDDSAAIKAAQGALTDGSSLYFPHGDYRFAQQHPAGEAAVSLSGLSNITVEFSTGARLLMDNLDADGHGTSHGIRVQGTASHVTLLNPTIEWVTAPSTRSFGDGISILGWPSDSAPPPEWTGSTGTVEFVSVVNGRVVNAPQTGAVVMGASDVTFTGFTAIATRGDGLHVNASRRVTVNGLVAQDTGDDGLAFVTYHHDTQLWTYGPTDGPFNQDGLGEWNNSGSVATNIRVTGGRANGVRVQGGYDITITDVEVTGKEFGVQVNSAIATGPGDWTSVASRDVEISDVTIDGAQTGIVLATNNITGTEDSKWWDFSGVTISDVAIRDSRNWSLAVETPGTTTSRFSGVTLRNIDAEVGTGFALSGGKGGILLASLHDSVIDGVHLDSAHDSDINIFGAAQIRGGTSLDQLTASNLTVDGVSLDGAGRILIQDLAGAQFGDISSSNADSAAVVLYRVADASFDTITANLPGRGSGEGYGVRLLQLDDVDIASIVVMTDNHVGSSWWAVELGGGNPDQAIAGDGVRIDNVTYVSGRDATSSDIVVQGGPYGPVNWYIRAFWRHDGEASPQWRSAVYGDLTPA